MSTNADLYAQDFYTWTQTTAALIRAGTWADIDPESLAEEVESLGKSQQRELSSRLDVLLMHLLKWRYQPEGRQTGQSWRSTIRTQRRELRRLLAQNPGLGPMVVAAMAESYAEARLDAADETDMPLPIPSYAPLRASVAARGVITDQDLLTEVCLGLAALAHGQSHILFGGGTGEELQDSLRTMQLGLDLFAEEIQAVQALSAFLYAAGRALGLSHNEAGRRLHAKLCREFFALPDAARNIERG